MHVHLDHQSCLELAVLRGDASAVREFSKAVIAERGVTHRQINFIPVMIETETHPHHAEAHAPDHIHIHPRN
jgi:CopG family transcriptional regulator, nickel-responsive regulator